MTDKCNECPKNSKCKFCSYQRYPDTNTFNYIKEIICMKKNLILDRKLVRFDRRVADWDYIKFKFKIKE